MLGASEKVWSHVSKSERLACFVSHKASLAISLQLAGKRRKKEREILPTQQLPVKHTKPVLADKTKSG